MSKRLYTHAQLRILNTVLEEGSYTAAAKSLGMSQSAISQSISKLESNINLPLFVLRGRDLVPTDFCIELGGITSRIHDLEDNLNALLQRSVNLDQGSLTIALCNVMPGLKLANNFNQLFPNITLELRFGNYRESIDRVVNREAEIGILANPRLDNKFSSAVCCKQRLVAVVSSNHPLAVQDKVNLHELDNYKLVFRTAGSITQRILDDALKKANLLLRPTYVLSNQQSVYDVVYHSYAVGFVWSESAARRDGLCTVPIVELDECYDEVVFSLISNRSRVVEAFFDCIEL